jgi:hypothetical protein
LSNPLDPIVVTIRPAAPEPSAAYIADVLVVLADHGHSSDRGTEFFHRYPGLALVLTVGEMGEASALFRDGTVLAYNPLQPRVAELLYICWATGLLHGVTRNAGG